MSPGANWLPFVVAEVRVRDAGGHDQVVVRHVAVGQVHDARVGVDADVASASHTRTFLWRRRIQRIGDAMSPGERPAVAT